MPDFIQLNITEMYNPDEEEWSTDCCGKVIINTNHIISIESNGLIILSNRMLYRTSDDFETLINCIFNKINVNISTPVIPSKRNSKKML